MSDFDSDGPKPWPTNAFPGTPGEKPFGKCVRAISSFPKPVIAAVNGVGIGWGITILGHCDFLFMAKDARLRAPFTQLGLVGEGASTVTFAMKMGWQNAAHVLMSSRFISADDAKSLGLAFQVCEKEK